MANDNLGNLATLEYGIRELIMIEITWGDFKNKIINEHRDDTWAYRGQASEKWQLESTLFRFISRSQKEIQAAGYYQILLSVLSNEKIKNEASFDDCVLPEKSPFLIATLSADEDHNKAFRQTFQTMIRLRHQGFPSPLLDWTKNPYVAAFFALSDVGVNENIAFYRMKIVPDFSVR